PAPDCAHQGRWPDGTSGRFYFMPRPTPGAANFTGSISTSPPVRAPIGDQSVNEGRPLTFTAGATDLDSGQTLTYTLEPGAAKGAAINSSSGVFLWTPSEAQGPGSYSLSVRITDSGSPPLSDAETITVTVVEANSSP